jgi:hypothetical protein
LSHIILRFILLEQVHKIYRCPKPTYVESGGSTIGIVNQRGSRIVEDIVAFKMPTCFEQAQYRSRMDLLLFLVDMPA